MGALLHPLIVKFRGLKQTDIMRKVKITVSIPRSMSQRYDALARRFRMSRSEVLRAGIERGYAAAAAWCQRISGVDDSIDEAVERLARETSAPGTSLPVAPPEPETDPEDQLREYAGTLVAESPDLDRDGFAIMIRTQAAVLGVAPTAARLIVADLLGEYFSDADGDPGGKVVPVPVPPSGVVDLD